jgi:Na+-transporting NADH:ubiquinone oxidoreductase subunit NqrF
LGWKYTQLGTSKLKCKTKQNQGVKHFVRYLLVWVSQNLSIPFWMVGHIHLSMNVYADIHEILMSFGMNIIVAVGFIIDYIETRKK